MMKMLLLFVGLFSLETFAQSVETKFPFSCIDKDKNQKYQHIVKIALQDRQILIDGRYSDGLVKAPVAIIGSDKKDPMLLGGIQTSDMISMWDINVATRFLNNRLNVDGDGTSWTDDVHLSIDLESGEGLYSGIVYEINGDQAPVKDYPVLCTIEIKK